MIFKVGKSKYACNIKCVDRIVKYENLTYVPSKQESFEGLYNYEGEVIKIFNLSKRLGAQNDDNTSHKKIIIVKDNNILVGVVVDEVLEVFNYDKAEVNREDIAEAASKTKAIDLSYVNDMILINNKIVIYVSITKIVEMELGESDLQVL